MLALCSYPFQCILTILSECIIYLSNDNMYGALFKYSLIVLLENINLCTQYTILFTSLLLLCLTASAILIDRLRIPSLCETWVLKVPGDKVSGTIVMSWYRIYSLLILYSRKNSKDNFKNFENHQAFSKILNILSKCYCSCNFVSVEFSKIFFSKLYYLCS